MHGNVAYTTVKVTGQFAEGRLDSSYTFKYCDGYDYVCKWCSLVSNVVEKTSTRRRSRIPCVVVEKNYDAST